MRDRNSLISFLQVFGILLVVIGHSREGTPEDPLWYTWIYTFHMPLFMFISGFLLDYTQERKRQPLSAVPLCGAKGFLWKKVRRLMVPYVVISSLAFLPKALLNRFAERPVEVSWGSYLHMLAYPWDNVIRFFWFLPTLFIIFILVVCGARLLRWLDRPVLHVALLAALTVLHVANPLKAILLFNMAGVVQYLLYFLTGYYCCRYRITQRIAPCCYAGFALTAALSVAMVTIVPDFTGKDVAAALNGILMSLFLGDIYGRRRWHFLDHLYGSSYAIYLFSWFPQTASQQVFLALTHAPWQAGGLLAAVTGTYLPWLIYKWIVKHRGRGFGKCVAFLTGH